MASRRGLLIGIDAYAKIPRLDGCVNDATLVRSLLVEQFGFPEDNLTMLTNDQATRVAILAALDALVASTEPDDIVVIQYAGHGSQMTDREGLAPNGLDNTIMPVDSEGWQGDNRDITDDEIHIRLVQLARKTRHTTLLVDACHSATITRDAFGAKARFFPPDRRPVSALPPSPIADQSLLAPRGRSPSGWLPLGDTYVLLAGCRDEEVSYEYRPPEHKGKIAHGALTWFLCSELRRATAGTTWRDVFERAAANVTANNARQHPQMEGRIDREIFGVADVAPMRFVRVTGRTAQAVTLGAGGALGMTSGSRFAVYPQGTKSPTPDAALGEVEVTAVRAVMSEARVVAERTPGAIAAGSRAVETEHDYGDLRLAVRIQDVAGDPTAVAALTGAITGSPLLRVAVGDEAVACVYLLPPRRDAAAGPVPQLPSLDRPTWAIIGDDGRLVAPPKAAADCVSVVENLATLARYRQALALDNADPSSAIRGKVELDLLRRAADGSWILAEPDEGGHVVYHEGDAIAWRLTNRHEQPLHANLLDFGLGRGIDRLYPERGATDKVDGNFAFNIGTRAGDEPEFTLGFPDHFPYAPGSTDEATEGVEAFKLVLTTHEADFSFLEQHGVRDSGGSVASPVMMLLRTATGATSTREARKKVPLATEDWGTVTRSIVLRRRD
jgi:Caspase domain